MTGSRIRADHQDMRPSLCARQSALHSLWAEKCSGRLAPPRQAFDVVELREWLGSLCLVAVEDGGRDYFYRVFGTSLATTIGRELTGRRLSEVESEVAEAFASGYAAVVASAAPGHFAATFVNSLRTIRLSDLVLPLSQDGETVDALLTCTFEL